MSGFTSSGTSLRTYFEETHVKYNKLGNSKVEWFGLTLIIEHVLQLCKPLCLFVLSHEKAITILNKFFKTMMSEDIPKFSQPALDVSLNYLEI